MDDQALSKADMIMDTSPKLKPILCFFVPFHFHIGTTNTGQTLVNIWIRS